MEEIEHASGKPTQPRKRDRREGVGGIEGEQTGLDFGQR